MMRQMIIGLLAISLAWTANRTRADDPETPQSEIATADASALVLDPTVDESSNSAADKRTSDLVTTSEPVPMALGAECRTCIGDCREDDYWCTWGCTGPACSACEATFNGCIANCHANECS